MNATMFRYNAGGINCTWFIEGSKYNDGTVYICRYYSLHNVRDRWSFPSEVDGGARLIEDKERIVHSIRLDNGETYTVRNPRHVFAYDSGDIA